MNTNENGLKPDEEFVQPIRKTYLLVISFAR
jgi:hypothetical protein